LGEDGERLANAIGGVASVDVALSGPVRAGGLLRYRSHGVTIDDLSERERVEGQAPSVPVVEAALLASVEGGWRRVRCAAGVQVGLASFGQNALGDRWGAVLRPSLGVRLLIRGPAALRATVAPGWVLNDDGEVGSSLLTALALELAL